MHKVFYLLLISILTLIPSHAKAQGAIGGLDVNGAFYNINQKNGEIAWKGESPLNAFELGATARSANDLYYVAQPSGTTQNTLYKASLKSGTITQTALDLGDPVRAMFFKGKKLFAIFHNGTTGTTGLYQINTKTGSTKLILDLAELNIEPIPGAITQSGNFYYLLGKPETDYSKRVLIKFKAKAGSAVTTTEIVDSSAAPVLCDKIKINPSKKNFVCLASNSDETEVQVCKVTANGVATCSGAISGILRIGSGHTLLSRDGKIFYAFGYAPDEPDNQRLIKFNSKGVIKGNGVVSTIIIGAHFNEEATG